MFKVGMRLRYRQDRTIQITVTEVPSTGIRIEWDDGFKLVVNDPDRLLDIWQLSESDEVKLIMEQYERDNS